jgi:hypothetical protein
MDEEIDILLETRRTLERDMHEIAARASRALEEAAKYQAQVEKLLKSILENDDVHAL